MQIQTKVAFLGTGAMGSAIVVSAARALGGERLILTDQDFTRAQSLANAYGAAVIADNRTAVREADAIFLCVKPQNFVPLMEEITPLLRQSNVDGKTKILYSILAGISIGQIRQTLQVHNYPVIRLMPNTPATIGRGLMLYATDSCVTEAQLAEFTTLIAAAGTIERISESVMDAATVSGGCTPAFAYLFLEALADGGVSTGLSRDQALSFAATAVRGAMDMFLKTGKHPGELKDQVTSPGGSTICGVHALENGTFRGTVMEAVKAAYQRNLELGK